MTGSQPHDSSISPKPDKDRKFISRNRTILWVSATLFLASIIYNLTFNRIFILEIDEAHFVKRIMAALTGELPMIDFVKFTYAPGQYWLFGLFFKLFGPSLVLERLIWVIMRAFVVVITFLVSRYMIPKRFVFILVVMAMVMACVPYKTLFPLLTAVNLLAIIIYIEKKNTVWLLISGALAGFTLWFREDLGVFVIITVFLCFFFQHFSIQKFSIFPMKIRLSAHLKQIFTKQGLFLSISILAFLPLVIIYGIHGKARELVWELFIGGPFSYISRKAKGPFHFPNIRELFHIPLDWDAVFLWFPVFLFIFIFMLLSYRLVRQQKLTDHNLYVFVTLVLAVLTFNQTYQRAIFERLLENAVPIYVLLTYILAWKYEKIKERLGLRMEGRTKTTMIKGFAFVLLLTIPSFFILYGLTQKNVNDRLTYKRRKQGIIYSDVGVWLIKGQLDREIRSVRRVIAKTSRGKDQVLFVSTALIFYHATRRDLVNYDIQIEYFNEDNLERYFKEFEPKYVAIENWARIYFRWLSKSFQQRFEMNYAPIATRAGHTIFQKNQKKKTKKVSGSD